MRVEALGDHHLEDLLTVCRNIRAQDRVECMATMPCDDPESLAEMALSIKSSSWIVYHDGIPVAVLGFVPMWPTAWTAYAFGTEDFKKVQFGLTRFIRRGILPSLVANGAKLVQAMVWTEYREARKWLAGFGAREEALLQNYGKNGESFAVAVWRP